MPKTLDTRTALVTGASRGIGAGIARELAARGFKVIGTATTDDGAANPATDGYPLTLVPFRVMTLASGSTALMPWLLENIGHDGALPAAPFFVSSYSTARAGGAGLRPTL